MTCAKIRTTMTGPSSANFALLATDNVQLERPAALAAFQLIVPSIDEQGEIVWRIGTKFVWLGKDAAEYARVDDLPPRLDQAILAKAFRGELLPQEANEEPASSLEQLRQKDRWPQLTGRRRRTANGSDRMHRNALEVV